MLPIIGLLGIVLWPANSLTRCYFSCVKYIDFYLQQIIYLLMRLLQTSRTGVRCRTEHSRK
jgi:hypothetical protein